MGTGGTIASRLDYRTGAVIPAFSPGELYGSVPELADYCNLETEKLYGEFSENIGPKHWMGIAEAIGKEIKKGVQGIVVGHGTDIMHHTAAALSFMVQNSPVPIVMVGSQRSSDDHLQMLLQTLSMQLRQLPKVILQKLWFVCLDQLRICMVCFIVAHG